MSIGVPVRTLDSAKEKTANAGPQLGCTGQAPHCLHLLQPPQATQLQQEVCPQERIN